MAAKKKKRNPNDLTLRNLRALRKASAALHAQFTATTTLLNQRLDALEKRAKARAR